MDSGYSSGFNRKTSLNSDFLRWTKSTSTGSKISHHHQQTNPHRLFSIGDDDDDAGPTNEMAFGGGTTPPAAGGVASTGFPFTGAQWKELERQAMIYKCMISCVPVLPHLLFPLDSAFSCKYCKYSIYFHSPIPPSISAHY
ncbi:uncharacterized protein LOC130992189 [Salvia miltiorrhiza]|uniref:uncharacterized protein LOC130992189 n=1 Tax=Salvia miltiorrhiza TaxID=226208 RepID=UPI0025ABD9D7|nr:uncharacterized protein LOC130992189 [Salvia miltiorrhiza]